MRKIYLCLALLFVFSLQSTAAYAGPTYKEFVQAWTERDARYVKQHNELDRVAREATASFLHFPQSGPHLEQMIAAIKAASYVDGRGAVLRDLRIQMEKKPSTAKIELWLQEHGDATRTDSRALQARFDDLKRMSEAGQGGSDSYFEGSIAAIVMASTLQGKAEELGLIDQNLSSYVRAQGQEDSQRREARARFLGAISAALRQTSSTPLAMPLSVTTRCTLMVLRHSAAASSCAVAPGAYHSSVSAPFRSSRISSSISSARSLWWRNYDARGGRGSSWDAERSRYEGQRRDSAAAGRD